MYMEALDKKEELMMGLGENLRMNRRYLRVRFYELLETEIKTYRYLLDNLGISSHVFGNFFHYHLKSDEKLKFLIRFGFGPCELV